MNSGRRQKKTSTLPAHQTASPSHRIMLFYISYVQGQLIQVFDFFQDLGEKQGWGKEGKGEEKRRREECGVGGL